MNIENRVLEDYRNRNLTSGKVCGLLNTVCKAEDDLFNTLTEEQKKLYRIFNDREMQLHCEELEDAILYGFRYAITLVNELKVIKLGEDDD